MIEIENLSFRYPGSRFSLAIDALSIAAGETVAILGPSGCGKTTLLNLVSGIQLPDSGTLKVLGTSLPELSDARRRDFRIRRMGMIFQEFELVDYLTTADNILLPYAINASLEDRSDAGERARELVAAVGLEGKWRRRPGQLSRGEQQRVAICRALVTHPQILLADEPTGNLDPVAKSVILDLLFEQCRQRNLTLLFVTHDHSLLEHFDRTLDFGKLRLSHNDEVPA